jgi:hypothetical protein
MRISKRGIRAALFGMTLAYGSGTWLHAEEMPPIKFNEWLKEMTIKGDVRLRHESIHRNNIHGSNTANGTSQRDRHRQRFRLRLNLDFKLPSGVEAKFQLASGTGEQVSTNQSFDNLSSEKGIWIDRAFLQWKPAETIRLAAGKMSNPMWLLYTSDVVWDSDFNPEGASQGIEFLGLPRTKLFFNALQMVADEDSGGTQDQFLFSQQLGAEVLVFDQSKITGAVALHEWKNERVNDFGQLPSSTTAVQDGNRRINNGAALINDFRVVEYTGEYKTALFNIPLSFQGTFISNVKSTATVPENNGFQYGVIVGKARDAKTLELGLFYKRVETDATVADIADSDFGTSGGTNRKGVIGWVGFAPNNWSLFQVKYSDSKTLNTAFAPGVKPVQRYQVDYSVRF